jgi:hypothetical protein
MRLSSAIGRRREVAVPDVYAEEI